MSHSNNQWKSRSDGTYYVNDGLGVVYQCTGKKKGKTQYKAIFKLTTAFFDHPEICGLFEYMYWDDVMDKCRTWGSTASTSLKKYETNLNKDTALFRKDIDEMIRRSEANGFTDIFKKDPKTMIHGYHLCYELTTPAAFLAPDAWNDRKDDCIFCGRHNKDSMDRKKRFNRYMRHNQINEKLVEMLMPPQGHKEWTIKALQTFKGVITENEEDAGENMND